MKITEIIRKKKLGEKLTKEEIDFFVNGYTNGSIPDYQISPLLMAIYFQGMDKEETGNLTRSFVNSGDRVDLSSIQGIKVDKHSTGGVGDKISIIVLPIVSSLGIPVAKLSGKGLGHTGGTIDKLESIPGFTTEISLDKFKDNVKNIGVAIAGQTGDLTPADKKFYALRDVTETVDSIPLIAASIMSKKIASGADAIVLDVKTGEGAFMKTLEDSKALAKTMVEIGTSLGKTTVALITNMNEPLGKEIGNANEIKEAIEILKGNEISGLYEVALEVSSHMVLLGKKAKSIDEAKELVIDLIKSGKALNKLKELILSQGGDSRVVDDYSLLPSPKHTTVVLAEKDGYIEEIRALEIGTSAMLLGAGRFKKDDKLDYSAGISLNKSLGDKVKKGEVLCSLNHNKDAMNKDILSAVDYAKKAFIISESMVEVKSPIFDIIKAK